MPDHVGDSQAVTLTQCGEPMRFAISIDLRNDFDSVSLGASRRGPGTPSRRLLALAEVYDSRTDASRIGGVGLQIIRDWVLRFNARGLDGLVDGKSPGAPRSSTPITAAHWRRLLRPARSRRSTACALAAQGPDVRHLARRHGRARVEGARLRQDLGAAAPLRAKRAGREAFKKNFPAELRRSGRGFRAVGPASARRISSHDGHGPRAPRDQRTELARSVPRRGKAWSCPGATPTPWRRTSSRSVPPSIPAPRRC